MSKIAAKLKKTDYGYLLEFKSDDFDISINEMNSPDRTKLKVKKYLQTNNILLENCKNFDFLNESYQFPEGIEDISEMDLFDVERRDLYSMKDVLDAPNKAHKVIKANTMYPKKRLKGMTRQIVRDGLHKPEQFDSLYNAMGILQEEPARKPKRKAKKKN